MRHKRFFIDDYIKPHEAFHFARKHLEKRFPEKAHDHDYFEVFLIERGRTAHWINGEMQTLEPGQLMFIRPHDQHALKADRVLGCQIINVMFRISTAEHLATRYKDVLADRFFDSKSDQPELHTLGPARFERAVNVAGQLKTAHRTLARIEEFLLTLTNRVADVSSRTDSLVPGWFSAACSAAQAPDVFRRGAPGFVEACGRSHEHVCRTCSAVFGVTPTAFINRIRIEHAAHLLRADDLSIEQVADACGFDNKSYFYRLFQRQYGLTPRRYRLQNQRNPFTETV